MRNQYKVLAEKYETIQENIEQEPVMNIDEYGNKGWFVNGKLHRLDGPAIIYTDGGKDWYVNGELHRLDGPAVEGADGSKGWYVNGELHRLDGPATVSGNGSKLWYVNGKLHRLDGPAIEWPDGKGEWYINGKQFSEKDFKTQVKIYKGLKALTRIRSKQP